MTESRTTFYGPAKLGAISFQLTDFSGESFQLADLPRQMRRHQADELPRGDDFGVFPEAWKVPLVAGDEIVGACGVRTLQKFVVFRIAGKFQLVRGADYLRP